MSILPCWLLILVIIFYGYILYLFIPDLRKIFSAWVQIDLDKAYLWIRVFDYKFKTIKLNYK